MTISVSVSFRLNLSFSIAAVQDGDQSRAHCGIQCGTQSRIAERLRQALYGTLLKQAWTHGLAAMRGHEDDWNVLAAALQLLLQIGPAHARHGDVEDQAADSIAAI